MTRFAMNARGRQPAAGVRAARPVARRRRAARSHGARRRRAHCRRSLRATARLAGGELYALGFDANRDRPRLRTHDRFGHRIDTVEFHPAYHRLMAGGDRARRRRPVVGTSREPGAHVARAALSYLHHQAEPGTSCPLTMTHAAVPALRRAARTCANGPTRRRRLRYDPRDVPIADKAGVTIGMGMTEKQGGSRRAREHDRADAAGDGERRVLRWSGTSGSSPRRCPMASWCSRRRRAD